MKKIVVGRISKKNIDNLNRLLKGGRKVEIYKAKSVSVFEIIRFNKIIFVLDKIDFREIRSLWFLGHSLPYSFRKKVEVFIPNRGLCWFKRRFKKLLERKGCQVKEIVR